MGGAHPKAQRWAGHIQRFSGGKCHRSFRILLSGSFFFFNLVNPLSENSLDLGNLNEKKKQKQTIKVFVNITVKRTNQNKVLSSRAIETKLR